MKQIAPVTEYLLLVLILTAAKIIFYGGNFPLTLGQFTAFTGLGLGAGWILFKNAQIARCCTAGIIAYLLFIVSQHASP
jgi:hypothetical protein